MKIISYNVNGVRAAVKKGLADFINSESPDALCLQETKANPEQVLEALAPVKGYRVFALGAEKAGYSGTAILTKKDPIAVSFGIGVNEHDKEGRVVNCEFEDHFLVTVYTPNSSEELKRLPYRQTWDVAFRHYIKELDTHKPVILCGDLNVAHRPIDIARPKANYNKTSGYTQIEIDGMDALQNEGLKDSFRFLHPSEVAYSWWSFRGGARENNIGWRIDYFLVSDRWIPKVQKAFIMPEIGYSDHCPVGIVL